MKPAKHLIQEDGEHSPNCFPCKIRTVTMAPSAMLTRSPEAARAVITDPQLEKDRESYRRLRRDGEQPKHLKGSAELEAKANESFEIETGWIVEDRADRLRLATEFAGMPEPSASPIVRETA
jgi:hypothetical protein